MPLNSTKLVYSYVDNAFIYTYTNNFELLGNNLIIIWGIWSGNGNPKDTNL